MIAVGVCVLIDGLWVFTVLVRCCRLWVSWLLVFVLLVWIVGCLVLFGCVGCAVGCGYVSLLF